MRKTILAAAGVLFAMTVPAGALAQTLPPAVIAVVDTQRIYTECTACAAANQQLLAQRQQIQQRAQQLGLVRTQADQPTILETELQALQSAAGALPQGQEADPALQTRAQNYQTQVQNAEREIATREQQLQRNRAHVLEQVQQRLNPIIRQVMQQRGANLSVPRDSTLGHAPSIEITDSVLALLNQQLPSVDVNAPAPQPGAQQQNQGR